MSTSSAQPRPENFGPDVSSLVTEDDTPVDNIYSEKQQRLLTDTLYASWAGPPPGEDGAPRTFFAAANVGLFITAKDPPLVPDVLVSLDVAPHADLWAKEHRSYFVWEFGKVPDVVIEVVSNREGDELGEKRRRYARMRIQNYVVWDPSGALGGAPLRAFDLRGHLYTPMKRLFFEELGLGLSTWEGSFEGCADRWLRWHDVEGVFLPTGKERAESEKARAESEKARAESEKARAERMAAKLRAMGVDPDSE